MGGNTGLHASNMPKEGKSQTLFSLTCSVPAEAHALGWRPSGHVDGEEADHEAGKVCHQVGSIGSDGQTVRQHTT